VRPRYAEPRLEVLGEAREQRAADRQREALAA